MSDTRKSGEQKKRKKNKGAGECDAVRPCRSWAPRSIKGLRRVTAKSKMAPFRVSAALLLHHITQQGEFHWPSWVICFLLPPPPPPSIPFIFCCFFLSATSGWWFLQKGVVISPYSTSRKTLVYSGEWGVWWKPASSEKIGCRQSPHFPPSSW